MVVGIQVAILKDQSMHSFQVQMAHLKRSLNNDPPGFRFKFPNSHKHFGPRLFGNGLQIIRANLIVQVMCVQTSLILGSCVCSNLFDFASFLLIYYMLIKLPSPADNCQCLKIFKFNSTANSRFE